MITTSNLYPSIKAIIPLMLKSGNIYQHDGHDHYEVMYQRMDKVVPTDKPVIFFHGLNTTGANRVATCHLDKTASFRIGIKYTESALEPDWQRNRLAEVFSPETLFKLPMTFTYNGTSLENESIAKLGITDCSCGGMVEYFDNDCECYVSEMLATLTISFHNSIN